MAGLPNIVPDEDVMHTILGMKASEAEWFCSCFKKSSDIGGGKKPTTSSPTLPGDISR